MARIRTIKPEFWVSEQVVDCSPIARLLFIGMWNFCDDGGVHPASCRMLKMEVFPGDDVSPSDIERYVSELISAGLLTEYEAGGKRFWHVTGWRHQKIEKPTKKYPGPPNESQGGDDQSPTCRQPVDDRSTNDPPPVDPGKESMGNTTSISLSVDTGGGPPSKPEPPKKPDKRGHRLPDDWEPTDVGRAFAEREGFTPAEIGRIAEQFRDYWHAESGAKASKRDWSAAWRTWIRREQPGRGKPSTGPPGNNGPAFDVATLWDDEHEPANQIPADRQDDGAVQPAGAPDRGGRSAGLSPGVRGIRDSPATEPG